LEHCSANTKEAADVICDTSNQSSIEQQQQQQQQRVVAAD
jgi:hypothetical protein